MKKNKTITGFKTPENYFGEFEAQLFRKIDEVNLPKSAGFKVPENYFENFEEQVLISVKNSEKPSKVISLFPKFFGYAAAAAASLIIGFAVFNNKSNNENLDALQLATIDDYIEEGNLNLDLYDVTTFIEDEDIANLDLETQKFSEATLKNYLLENMDEETLIDEQ